MERGAHAARVLVLAARQDLFRRAAETQPRDREIHFLPVEL